MTAVSAFSASRRGSRKPGKYEPFPELRDAQLDRPGPRLPDPVAVAVALRQPIRALLAPRRSGLAADVELHEPLGSEAEHLTHQIGVGRLLQQPLKGHHLVGHRFGAPVQVDLHNPTLPENRRWPPSATPRPGTRSNRSIGAASGAMGATTRTGSFAKSWASGFLGSFVAFLGFGGFDCGFVRRKTAEMPAIALRNKARIAAHFCGRCSRHITRENVPPGEP
jgi:hypothetical protein